MNQNWKFHWGRRFQTKKTILGGGMNIFRNHTFAEQASTHAEKCCMFVCQISKLEVGQMFPLSDYQSENYLTKII